MATETQLLSLPTAGLDYALHELIHWLVSDKANTLFAFLFGVGFSLQMRRTQARGANFDAIYLRRLLVLLAFGWAHLFFVWTWDILHLYALSGLALYAMRRMPDRWLLIIGIPLALFGRHLTAIRRELGASLRGGSRSPPPAAARCGGSLRAAAEGLHLLGDRGLRRHDRAPRLVPVCARSLHDRRVGRTRALAHASAGIPADVSPLAAVAAEGRARVLRFRDAARRSLGCAGGRHRPAAARGDADPRRGLCVHDRAVAADADRCALARAVPFLGPDGADELRVAEPRHRLPAHRRRTGTRARRAHRHRWPVPPS